MPISYTDPSFDLVDVWKVVVSGLHFNLILTGARCASHAADSTESTGRESWAHPNESTIGECTVERTKMKLQPHLYSIP